MTQPRLRGTSPWKDRVCLPQETLLTMESDADSQERFPLKRGYSRWVGMINGGACELPPCQNVCPYMGTAYVHMCLCVFMHKGAHIGPCVAFLNHGTGPRMAASAAHPGVGVTVSPILTASQWEKCKDLAVPRKFGANVHHLLLEHSVRSLSPTLFQAALSLFMQPLPLPIYSTF